MTRREGRSAVRRNENVLSFIRPPVAATGAGALDLVYQAAELFSGIENNAREMETRAQAMCKSAAGRLRLAEQRTEFAENALRALSLTRTVNSPTLLEPCLTLNYVSQRQRTRRWPRKFMHR